MQSASLVLLRRGIAEQQGRLPSEADVQSSYPGARLSAVLALLYPHRGEPHLVLTLRTPSLREHSGQISLPGGRIDPHDFSAAEAALRETREELGIATDEVELWGGLMPIFTQTSNFVLIPFVGETPARPPFVPNSAEVAEVIEVPFGHLLDPRSVGEERWWVRGRWRRVGFYRYGEHKIWGATGRILRQLVELAGGPAGPEQLLPPGEVDPDASTQPRSSLGG
jgi:8-oxo-dGTP pyrophosphatase MutT (NUDIX family)